MDYQNIRVEYRGRAAWVTLDRPQVRNAMDERTLGELAPCAFRTAARTEQCTPEPFGARS